MSWEHTLVCDVCSAIIDAGSSRAEIKAEARDNGTRFVRMQGREVTICGACDELGHDKLDAIVAPRA